MLLTTVHVFFKPTVRQKNWTKKVSELPENQVDEGNGGEDNIPEPEKHKHLYMEHL